jgi:putative sterol carrier protein
MSEVTFATQEWLDRFRGHLNSSAEYLSATTHWNDDALYVIDADPDIGFAEPVGYYIKWQSGAIVEAKAVANPSPDIAVFVVRARYSIWEEAYRTKTDVGVALLTGKFQFQGPFAKAAANVVGEVMMLETAYTIPTRFLPTRSATSRQ